MTESKARKILGDMVCLDDTLYSDSIKWPMYRDINEVKVEYGMFTTDQIEAVAWWMRNMTPKP